MFSRGFLLIFFFLRKKKEEEKEKEKEATYYLSGVEDNSAFEAELRFRINAAAASLRYTSFFSSCCWSKKKK